MPRYDVVFIGGGLVGQTCALALQQACRALGREALKIRVLEAAAAPEAEALAAPTSPSFDGRASALARSSVATLTAMGLWERLADHAAAIEHVHVSEEGAFGATRLHAQDAQAAFGQVVRNRQLGQALYTAVKAEPGIELVHRSVVTALQPQADGVRVTCRSGEDCHAALVILADGGRSPLQKQLGFQVRQHDYRQQAVVTCLACDRPARGWAFERFTRDGAIALLPLADAPGNHYGLVWTLPTELAHIQMAASERHFQKAIEERFGGRLGKLTLMGKPEAYPLRLSWVSDAVRPGVMVLGNAAHALHPVAGQGFNLSLRDGLRLAEVLAQREPQTPLGSMDLLRAYHDSRSSDQWQILTASDRLISLFSESVAPIRKIRRLGLFALERSERLKQSVARLGMGEAGSFSQAAVWGYSGPQHDKGA